MANIVQNSTINGKSIDGVLGIQTRDRRIVGSYETTELWFHWYMMFFWLVRSNTYTKHESKHR